MEDHFDLSNEINILTGLIDERAALLTAMIANRQMNTTETQSIEAALLRLIDAKRKLVEIKVRRDLHLGEVMAWSQIQDIVSTITGSVKLYVKDKETLRAISEDTTRKLETIGIRTYDNG